MHEEARIAPLDLYSAFVEWCEDHYEKPITPVSRCCSEKGDLSGETQQEALEDRISSLVSIRLRSQRDIRLVHQRQNGAV